MFGVICGMLVSALGVLLAVGGGYVGFQVLPQVINDQILQAVVLYNDTIQLERFIEPPIALNFKVFIFNITNGEEVIDGAVPQLKEIGPYFYKQYVIKDIYDITSDNISYTQSTRFEFDEELSYPLTEDDFLTVVNVPFNAILQGAEVTAPGSMIVLNPLLNQVFGAENSQPVARMNVRRLLFDGILMCESPNFLGRIACDQIRESAQVSETMRFYENGSFSFSFFNHKDGYPSVNITVSRGTTDSIDLGRILDYDGSAVLSMWNNGIGDIGDDIREESGEESNVNDNSSEDISIDYSFCDIINGTDSAIFRPFVNRSDSLFAFNPDICRSVELRYHSDSEYDGVPSVRYQIGEWLLANDEGCFCLNMTAGVRQENGCLYPGAMELYTCTGAFMVFSSPHFLHADSRYRNGVIGLTPRQEMHEIFVELEPVAQNNARFSSLTDVMLESVTLHYRRMVPNSGTILRGSKRGQFNLFLRPISSITRTANLRTTLTPVLWVDDGVELPEHLVQEVKTTLLRPMRLVSIIRIVAIILGILIIFLGIWLTVVFWNNARTDSTEEIQIPNKTTTTKKEQPSVDFENVSPEASREIASVDLPKRSEIDERKSAPSGNVI